MVTAGLVDCFSQAAGTTCLPCQTPPASTICPTRNRSGGQHAQARGGSGLALQAVGPFGRSQPHRIEQRAARIVRQLLAGTLGDQSAQQRGAAAIVGPLHAGLAHDRPIEHVAVAIGRQFHGDLAVARIAIGNGEFVPFDAQRHAEHVGDGEAVPSWLVGEVCVLRELIVQLRLGRRHLAVGKRNTIEHSDDALGHRTQVMQHGRPERHGPSLRPQAWSSPAP